MSERGLRGATIFATTAVLLACTPLILGWSQGARPTASGSGIPRTSDGHPDLQGVWTNYDATPFERPAPGEVAAPRLAVSTQDWLVQEGPKSPLRASMVIDPPDGRVPLRRDAAANRDALMALPSDSLLRYGPWERCITRGVPNSLFPGAYNNGHQIVQTASHVLIHSEMIHEARVIPLDGRPHLSPSMRSWDGDSRGRWEGDSFVVEVTDFNEDTWFDRAGNFHSDQLRVTERYTPTSANHLLYEATIEDPKVFTRPWKIRMPLYRRLESGKKLHEYKCVEFVEELMYGHLGVVDPATGQKNK